jgi:hypothetical protein
MTKYPLILAALATTLSGCSLPDQFLGEVGTATVVSILDERDKKCRVLFKVEGDGRVYSSIPETLYKESRCQELVPGQTVPIVKKRALGDGVPYVLFEDIVR